MYPSEISICRWHTEGINVTCIVFVIWQYILETPYQGKWSIFILLYRLCKHFSLSPICWSWPWTWAVTSSLTYQYNCYVGIVSVYLRRSERLWQVEPASFLGKVSSVIDSSKKHLLDTRYEPNMALGTLDEVGPPCISNPLRSISDAAAFQEGFSDSVVTITWHL